MDCPICNRKLDNYYIESISGNIGEELGDCTRNGHVYRYLFAYGDTEEQINGVTFSHSYTVTDEELHELTKFRYKLITLAKLAELDHQDMEEK